MLRLFCKKVFLNIRSGKKLPSAALTVSQVKVIGGAGGPQPHGIDGVVHVTRDGRVVRHCQNNLQTMRKQRDNRDTNVPKSI